MQRFNFSWPGWLITLIRWITYTVCCGRTPNHLTRIASDEEAILPSQPAPETPRRPEVAAVKHAASQNDDLEAWLGLRKTPSTAKSPRKMREMSIAKLTSGVADGGRSSQ